MSADSAPPVDAHLWARQIVAGKRSAQKKAPAAADLAASIIDIDTADMMKGSSTIDLTLVDPGWALLDSGFFDADADGRLDAIDVNYPEGSKYWWRLTQASPGNDTGHEQIVLTFMERSATYLMEHHGPLKASRAKKTRAEFLKMLCDRVKAGGGINFHSRELHVKQTIAGDPKSKTTRRTNKDPGISPGERTPIKGHQATVGQLREVERALDVAAGIDNCPELAVIAMLCAGIGESSFTAVRNQGNPPSRYWGVFQGSMDAFAIGDTEGMARHFLQGGKGFQGGGAIALANAHPDMDPGEIATRVEASGEPADFYGKWKREAELLLQAYGGTGFAGTSYRQQYNFDVGSPDDPHENFWDASNRLADEVAWPFFLNGNDAYFDDEMTLIKQQPVAVVRRDDPAVVSFNVTWDTRHIATEVTLVLVCDLFEFHAGEVFKLVGFGPASTGSTAKLPGRWLIGEADRKPSELTSTFTLKQPTRPKKEPPSQVAQRNDPASAGADISGSPKDIIDNVVLPIARECGIDITPLEVSQANARHGPTAGGNRSDHQGPPDHAWAADMSNGTQPTPEMDKLAKALQRKFDLSGWEGAIINGYKTIGGKRYRFQLIYRYADAEAGNHFNHVHFGVERVPKFG